MINRTEQPVIKDAVDFEYHLKPYEKFVLDNGVTVYAINAGAEEVLQVEWLFFAGNNQEEQNLVAATTNHLLKNGTRQKTAFEINECFEFYGASLSRHCYNETANIVLHCLNKHLQHLLPVVQELVTEAVFPEEELALYKQNNKQRLQVSLKKSEFVAGRLIDEYLYGINHPYGKYSSFETYDALQQKQLQDFYQHYYRNGKCIIFIAGKIPPAAIGLLNQYFGQLPFATDTLVKTHPAKPAVAKKYRITNDAEGVQGSIRMARPFPNRHHPDFIKCMVLNNVFGGFFGSRLMSNIREDKGYTYGIYSYLQNHLQQSAWVVSTEAGKDVCEATIAEVYKEMEDLREEIVDEEELLLVKNYMLGTILGDLDGPFHIIGRWKNVVLNNLPENYFYTTIDTIKNITAEELQVLAQQYLRPEDFYELVVV